MPDPAEQPGNPDLRKAFEAVRRYPLLDAMLRRRTRRVSRGLAFESGTLSFRSKHPPQPLTPLEEALLIISTGVTGMVLQETPYRTAQGKALGGMPALGITGIATASPDSAHPTYMLMWNDEGTYLIKHPDESLPPAPVAEMGPDELVAYVESLKVKLRDGRLDFPREFPAYLVRNTFAANVPGSTQFVPIVDVAKQYINGFFHVLAEEDGKRPVFRDDFNLYRPCGCERWIRSGFLNKKIPVPLSLYGKGRVEYESLFILQNIALTAAAIGLGGWIVSAFPAFVLFGASDLGEGLRFRHEPARPREYRLPLPRKANRTLGRLLRPGTRVRRALVPFPAAMPNPVGLDGHLEAYCPPYFPTMDAAIDAILDAKRSAHGYYRNPEHFARVFKPGLAEQVVEEIPDYREETVECVRAICNYIYDTYGRFPAHCNAIETPGIAFQAHHVDLDYYDAFFQTGYSDAELEHQRLWHGE